MINGAGFLAIASPTSRAASRPGADLFRQRAIGGGAPPADPAQRVVDPGKEGVLVSEVDTHIREVDLFAGEVSLCRRDDRRNFIGRGFRLRAGSPAADQSLGGFRALGWQLKSHDAGIAPGDGAEAHCRLENMIGLGFAHGVVSGLVTG